MNYLFFDCECANSFNKISKICSIGYCLTDPMFNLIKKEDIIINPQSMFDKHLLNNKNEVHLSYSKSKFTKASNFKKHYPKLKELFLSNVLVFGFSLDNDIKFLLDAYKRYNLEIINFRYVDVQQIYKKYSKETFNTSLNKSLLELGIDISNEVHHKSDDDAYMTMLVLKKIIEVTGKSLLELLDMYQIKILSVKDFVNKKEERERLKEEKKRLYLENKNKLNLLNKLYDNKNPNSKSLLYNGLTFSFSSSSTKNADKALMAQNIIYENSGITTRYYSDGVVLIIGKENVKKLEEDGIRYIKIDEILG